MTSRREAKAQTQQRLIDAMLEILHESGPLALTTGRIAERAGLAQPTFYVHFPDLDRAIEMAADAAGARLIAILASQRAVLDAEEGSAGGGRLRRAFRAALDGFAADRLITELFLRHRRDTASPFANRFRSVLGTGRDQLRDLLVAADVRSADVAAALILGMVIATVEGMLDGRITDLDAAVDRLVVSTRALIAPAETHGKA